MSATLQTSRDTAVEPFIDKHEVARRMDSTTRTVDSMMRRGLIPYYKLGYRVAFRWSEIQSHLVETCRVAARGKLISPKKETPINTENKTDSVVTTKSTRETRVLPRKET